MPQFLFILESVGTTELLLIGVVALMLLGPRRMPEMAKKLAKIMAEFRGTANEFRETWQKEIDLEQEAKAFDINNLETDTIPRKSPESEITSKLSAPTIREIDASHFESLKVESGDRPSLDSRSTDDPINVDDGAERRSTRKEDWL